MSNGRETIYFPSSGGKPRGIITSPVSEYLAIRGVFRRYTSRD